MDALFDTRPFQEQGFQVIRGVLTEDVLSPVRAYLEGQVQGQLRAACAETGCSSPDQLVPWLNQHRAEGGSLADRYSREVRDTFTGHFALGVRLSRLLWGIPRHGPFQSLLADLLSSPPRGMHLPPAARFILPGNTLAGVPPHQDLSYNRHLSSFITVWVPMVPVDDSCGGIAVYEGSGFLPEQQVAHATSDFWLDPLVTDGFTEIHWNMAPGDVLVLNSRIIHRSLPNLSDRIRLSVDYRFFGEGTSSTKHFLDLRTWDLVAPAGSGLNENL